MTVWTARVLTIFPDMFPGPLGHSLAGRALADGKWGLEAIDIRNFTTDTHRSVDDSPFGGGPGMVMRADVLDTALESVAEEPGPVIYLTPRGKPFDQQTAAEIAAGPGATLLCGRFEGIDARLIEERPFREISVGDFVLSGGEPAAFALIDACVRLLPGVIGDAESLVEESFAQGLLEYPQYTRPAQWRGRTVPDVLLSGHHENIRAWRLAQAETITRERRPDLWDRYVERAKQTRTNP